MMEEDGLAALLAREEKVETIADSVHIVRLYCLFVEMRVND